MIKYSWRILVYTYDFILENKPLIITVTRIILFLKAADFYLLSFSLPEANVFTIIIIIIINLGPIGLDSFSPMEYMMVVCNSLAGQPSKLIFDN